MNCLLPNVRGFPLPLDALSTCLFFLRVNPGLVPIHTVMRSVMYICVLGVYILSLLTIFRILKMFRQCGIFLLFTLF